MSVSLACLFHEPRRLPMAACVAALFALVAPEIGLCVAVDNCNDSGIGSLRAAIANTLSGGTVNMTGLHCSNITLEDSQIVFSQATLTILGPSSGVTIAHDGTNDRVFNHQGSGLLSLENLNITGGYPYSIAHNVDGGCIYSKGDVYLRKL